MKLRHLFTGAVTAVLLLGTAACGDGSGGSDGAPAGVAADLTTKNFATQIGDAMTKQQSTHMEADYTFQGQSMTMTGDIQTAQDLAGLEAQFVMTVPGQGNLEMRIVDGIFFLKGEGISPQQAKPWARIDLTDPSNPLGKVYEQLMANANPAQQVKMFEAVTDLENLGQQYLDGVETTHYRVTVDMQKALKISGLAGSAGMDPEAMAGQLPDEVTYEVWVATETALLTRMTMDMAGMQMDVHFSEWGKDVSVAAPPADQVADLDF